MSCTIGFKDRLQHWFARVQELTIVNQQLAAELARAEADRDSLQDDVAEAQDDLAAARTALRNMMRDQNRDST
ncbi:hypothetical protein [Streptomyces halobius]|uniref:Uncharacterized protein n=1 Tax=Streptomyces halobius TaxID=2879846 RepID=A0ABY4M1I9_9ACTN|nr:hypothetical protein [Streptomyces halobius]UQA91048.1 hypothetical protein K9S39_03385 [Streptomyces halobius]